MDQFELRRPDSSLYPLRGNALSAKNLRMWKISQPIVGAWHFKMPKLSELSTYDVQIQGKTSIVCSSTLQKEMEASTDSSGYTQLTTEPIINSDLLVLTTCENVVHNSANISLFDISGNIIASYSATETDLVEMLTKIRVPHQQFRIQTIVMLANGTLIQRMEKQLVSPTYLSIESTNQPYILSPNQTIAMNYTIRSALSGQVNVRLQVIDTLKLLGQDGVRKDLTFINETKGVQMISLPTHYEETFTTNLVIFAVSMQNNQTTAHSYENDETASVYLEFNSASICTSLHCLIISLLLLLHQTCAWSATYISQWSRFVHWFANKSRWTSCTDIFEKHSKIIECVVLSFGFLLQRYPISQIVAHTAFKNDDQIDDQLIIRKGDGKVYYSIDGQQWRK